MEPVRSRVWEGRREPSLPISADLLSEALDIHPITARTLLLREITSIEEGREFLQCRLASLPDPFLLDGMEEATERLATAIAGHEKIAVHGDYDVDGITGTALLVETLKSFGADVSHYIPLRLEEGYGLSSEALERAANEGARVAISVDCGISAIEEAMRATAIGIDLIITDHHLPGTVLPEALAVINPRKPGCPFPFKDLAGVGVAFFLLVGLRKRLREGGHFAATAEPDLRLSLDLVAMGTIADIVPLKGVNRILTRTGLDVISAGRRPGIRALKEVAKVKDDVTCGVVGFRLAPRLNAAGRLEDAALGVSLLLERSLEKAIETSRILDDLNSQRQHIEQVTLEQAIERVEGKEELGPCSIVLADERWHPGVIGIVASRLVERYHRPSLLIALDAGVGKGSGRSIRGLHLYQALDQCREFLQGFGGHEFAAGLTLREADLNNFRGTFEKTVSDTLNDDDLLPRLAHDGEVLFEELSREIIDEMNLLAPFGAGNPEPSFIATRIRAQQTKVLQEKHIRFTARQGGYSVQCIAFGMAERLNELSDEVDILFTPGINEWQGQSTIQLRVKDFRPAPPL